MRNLVSFFRFKLIRFLERISRPEPLYRLFRPIAVVRAAFKRNPVPLQLPAVIGTGWITPGDAKCRQRYYQNCALTFFPERLALPCWRDRCEFAGMDQLRDLQRQNLPAILVVCHFGPFFLLRRWLQAAGIRATTLVAGMTDERSYLNQLKDRVSLFPEIPRVFYPDQLRDVSRFLVNDHVLVIAIDSPAGNQIAVPVDDRFSFRMATGPLRLAARHGARLFPCTILDAGDWRFRIEIGRPVPAGFLAGPPDFMAAGKHLVTELLPRFQAHPEQCTKMVLDSFRPIVAKKPRENIAANEEILS